MSEETSRIQVLDDNTINKIAAGEVVERPSAIIREVVENAIDAGADDIRIDLEMGGTKLIKVKDNGSGMNRAEAQMALKRHATSKIKSDTDLFNIHTLGFRGEAIPSIASVSQFELLSRTQDNPVGTKVIVHGGKSLGVEAAGCPVGTTITARNLFFNVPARQKFLRSPNTEYSHCLEAVVREMLIRPHIDVEVNHNRVCVLRAPKTQSLKERAMALLGKHWGAVIPIEFETEYCTVKGLVSPVGVHRAKSANATYLYVNNRYVKDTAVRRAVSEAYQGIVPKGRYPLVLLSIEVNPAEVDVNVHPAKIEVRFQQVLDVSQAITRGLRTKLQEHGIRREVSTRAKVVTSTTGATTLPLFGSEAQTQYTTQSVKDNRPVSPLPPLPGLPTISKSASVSYSSLPNIASNSANVASNVASNVAASENIHGVSGTSEGVEPLDSEREHGGLDNRSTVKPIRMTNDRSTQIRSAQISEPSTQIDQRKFPPSFFGFSREEFTEQATEILYVPTISPMDAFAKAWPLAEDSAEYALGDLLPVPRFVDLRVIGQLKETYILCEGAGEMVIIDQHAAHERITLDAIQSRRLDFIGGFQQLLHPILIDLPPAQLARLLPLLPTFAEFGLEMDEFGGNTIRIRQIPTILQNSDWEQLIQDLVDDAMAGGKGAPVLDRLERALATKACHGSIRAGRTMSKFEMMELLEELDAVDFGVCAHGRPVAIRITTHELEKEFHRT
jgi:DNA mismatch repair protein MutL